jgi:hypothetical protein
VVLQAGETEQLIPLEIDFELLRRTRRTGLHGLGQPLKSFRDRSVDFNRPRPRHVRRRLPAVARTAGQTRAASAPNAGQPFFEQPSSAARERMREEDIAASTGTAEHGSSD